MRSSADSTATNGQSTFEIPVRVYYEDTDAAGVVYYANYLRYCERARTEWLRHLGFQQQTLLKTRQLAFVVRSVQAEYRSPARLDDALRIVTHVARVGGASIEFVQSVMRDAELLFDARIIIVCVNTARNRPAPIPQDIRPLLQTTIQS